MKASLLQNLLTGIYSQIWDTVERVLRFGFLAVHRWRHVMENILERKEWDDEFRPDKSLYWKNKLVLYSSILDSSTLIIEFS